MIKKDDVFNMSYKDITNLILEKEKKGINTLELFNKIVTLLELPASTIENKIGDYYTSLTTDKRFILVDGLWDLRKRHTSDKLIVDTLEDDDMIDTSDEDMTSDEESDYDDEYDDVDEDMIETSPDDEYETPNEEEDDLSSFVVLDEDELN